MSIENSPSRRPRLLLVVGAGRSGTSTAAGALSRLGFTVPPPQVPADDSNPRGFYEPQWVVDFHERLLTAAGVRTNDVRPEALARAEEYGARADVIAELTGWLGPLAGAGDLVVKDPRTFWFHDLWDSVAEKVGLEVSYLTMLRHPAEVARSRDTYYLAGQDAELRRAREAANVASWCNALLVTERVTRGSLRAFVPYADLMADWRSAVRRADAALDLCVTDRFSEAPHPIDDFIDSGLNRSQVHWDEMTAHPLVSELAEELWAATAPLVVDPADQAAVATIDELGRRYDALYTLASDLTMDQRTVERMEQRRQLKKIRDEAAARVRRLRERIERLEAEKAASPGRRARRLARRALGREGPSDR